ncbi:MAG: DUF4157 domain-containing protein [Cyanobacteria bacterium P01_F01_bin.150]
MGSDQAKSSPLPLHDFLRPRQGKMPLLQPKLKIGAPNDKYEREADRIAEQVMRMPDGNNPTPIHPISSIFSQPEGDFSQQEKFDSQRANLPSIQRKPISLNKKAVNLNASPIVHRAVNLPGRPLEPNDRRFFERGFGQDFSQVRIHTGDLASASASFLHAQAYTVGQDIVFGASNYAPNTTKCRQLLSHELVHVMQQSSAQVPIIQRQKIVTSAATAEGQIVTESDPSAGVIRVYYLSPSNQQHGLAEVHPPPGVPLDPKFIDIIDTGQDANGVPVVKVKVRKSWQGAVNKETKTSVSEISSPSKQDLYDQQIEKIRSLYKEYLSDYDFQIDRYDTIITSEEEADYTADYASEKELLSLEKDPEFQEWVKRRRKQIYDDLIKQQNLAYLESLGGPGIGITPEEARRIVGEQFVRNDLGIPQYDDNGIHIGYMKEVYDEKILEGAVSTITREYYDLTGERVHQDDPISVLTPEANFFQDAIRSIPLISNFIHGREAELGISLRLENFGEKLSTAERIDSGIAAVPFGDDLREVMEVASNVSLSGGKDLERLWEGRSRVLSSRERLAKRIQLGASLLTAGIGRFAKIRPKFRSKFRYKSDLSSGHKLLKKKTRDVDFGQSTTRLTPRSEVGLSSSLDAQRNRSGFRTKQSSDSRTQFLDKAVHDHQHDHKTRVGEHSKNNNSNLKKPQEITSDSPYFNEYDAEIHGTDGHTYRRKKDGSGWCQFSPDPPQKCNISDKKLKKDYLEPDYDPEIETAISRELRNRERGKLAQHDALSDIKSDLRRHGEDVYLPKHLREGVQPRRDLYMGPTPRKRSPIGEYVISKMRKEGLITGKKPNEMVRVKGPDGVKRWYPIADTDMGHIEPAVRYWNKIGKYLGPRHKKVLEWMKKRDNYILQHKSVNRKEGAEMNELYHPPEPQQF